MRTRMHIAGRFEMEFSGAPRVWNEHLRPVFGGPEATDEDGGGGHGRPPAEPAPEPPRERTPPPVSGAEAATLPAESDLDEILDDLAAAGGRRAEKDAVLVAVWAAGGARRDVTFREARSLLIGHEEFADVRVKPHLLKHVTRTRMLEPGAARETVRLTAKGRRYVASLVT